MNWYTANTGNHQGLVIEENTGRTVAVAYDKADAPLIAAAPELLEAVKGLLSSMETSAAQYRTAQTKNNWRESNGSRDNNKAGA